MLQFGVRFVSLTRHDIIIICIIHSLGYIPERIHGLPGYCNKGMPVLRVLCHSLTEVTEVPGKGLGIF